MTFIKENVVVELIGSWGKGAGRPGVSSARFRDEFGREFGVTGNRRGDSVLEDEPDVEGEPPCEPLLIIMIETAVMIASLIIHIMMNLQDVFSS